MKRHIASITGLALAASLAGCVDLEEQLVGTITSQYYATPAGLEAAVNGAYAQLREFFAREEGMGMSQMGTDTWTNGDQGGKKHFNNYGAALNASDDWFRFPWQSFYRGINTANAVIERAPGITGMDPALRDTRIAEARFLRALYYFYLVQMYGDVHLTLEENTGVQTEATRTPAAEVYDAIITDLEAAVTALPVSNTHFGRATRGAARHLLSKVYLTRAYKPYNQAGDFQRALDQATAVINQGTYSLLPTYADLWCVARPEDPARTGYCNVVGLNEANSEVVFSIQFTNNSAQFNTDQGNYLHLVYLSFYDDRQGMTRDLNNGRAFRRLRPTTYAINLWQRWVGTPGQSDVLDTRYDGSFQSVWIANRTGGQNATGTCPQCTSGEPIAVGDTAMWHPGYPVSDDFRRSKKYWIITPCAAEPCPLSSPQMEYDEFRFPTLKKFQDNTRPDFNFQDGGKDIYLMRLGETYLLAAEAALGLGNAAQAAELINVVRRRAATEPYKAMMEITAADVTLDFLLDERERELAGELHRWFDLVRTNKFVERVRAYNPQAAGAVQAFHALRPIPQTQIDLTSTPFPQNPGY